VTTAVTDTGYFAVLHPTSGQVRPARGELGVQFWGEWPVAETSDGWRLLGAA